MNTNKQEKFNKEQKNTTILILFFSIIFGTASAISETVYRFIVPYTLFTIYGTLIIYFKERLVNKTKGDKQ